MEGKYWQIFKDALSAREKQEAIIFIELNRTSGEKEKSMVQQISKFC